MSIKKSGYEYLINSNNQKKFTIEESYEILDDYINDKYYSSHIKYFSERISITDFFIENNYLHYFKDIETYTIKKPNIFILLSENKTDLYLTKAGILFLLLNADQFLILDPEMHIANYN